MKCTPPYRDSRRAERKHSELPSTYMQLSSRGQWGPPLSGTSVELDGPENHFSLSRSFPRRQYLPTDCCTISTGQKTSLREHRKRPLRHRHQTNQLTRQTVCTHEHSMVHTLAFGSIIGRLLRLKGNIVHRLCHQDRPHDATKHFRALRTRPSRPCG